MLNDYSLSLTVFPLVMVGLIFSLFVCARNWRLAVQVQVEEDVAAQAKESEEERSKRKESISNGLNVKEWVPDNPQVESAEADQGYTPPSGETVEAPQPPQMNSSPAACAMGGEDCDPLAREEEMAGCAICLSQFKSKQLVCESNNSSCQHIFHKDCMVDWLMKNNESCPMCREVYLIKAV
jgi:hypothetical protein